MDGTVLDKETYEPGPALDALGECMEARIPVVLNSSKTRAEMQFFYERLPILAGSPFVSENGGGVFFPTGHWEKPSGGQEVRGFWKITLGARHDSLLRVLKGAVEDLGLKARLFSEMTPEEIAGLTALPLEQAGLAREREFDEPFLIEGAADADLEALRRAIEKEGMLFSRGGRCYHVHGNSDKGSAVALVMDLYRQKLRGPIASAAVGDAANDLPLLRAVDKAYLVQGHDGIHDPDIPRGEGVLLVQGKGPEGFRRAVDDPLKSR